jgi:hypothetical protein
VKLPRLFLVCAAVAIAAACSNGSSSNVAPQVAPTNGEGSSPSLNQSVTFTVIIPAAAPPAQASPASHSKRRFTGVYLSPNTGSISIRLVAVNGVSLAQPPPAQPPTNVPASCRGSATGCQVSVPNVVAAVGVNTYTITTFAGSNGLGAVISTGIIAVTVNGNGTVANVGGDPTQLTLGGYVASLGVTVVPTAFTLGDPGTATVVVTPKDAAGATIVGNTQFAFPITLSVTGAGYTLSGPGLQGNGTIQLIEPQAASPPILLNYNGQGTSAVVSASSQNGAGATVTSPPVVVSAPTPTPVPTGTAIATLPPLSPAPTGTGPAPSATPSSLYLLNVSDNSTFEFSAPVNGYYSESARRGFGGVTPSCGSPYNLEGITVDGGPNVYVGAPEGIFSSCLAHFYAFPPNFVGKGAPSPIPFSIPGNGSEGDGVLQLTFDAPNGKKLDVTDDSDAYFIGRLAESGGKMNPTLGYPVKQSALEACYVSSGLPSPDPSCGNGADGDNSFFDELSTNFGDAPFAVGADGSLYIIATDEYLNPNSNPLFGNGEPAIIKVTPPNQISAGTITAEAAWIEGPNTFLSNPVSIAYDPVTNSLWVYDGGNAAITRSSSTPPPIAGQSAYLMEFPLTAFAGNPGPQNVAPTAFLSGQSYGRFAVAPGGSNPGFFIQPNAVFAGGGNVYVANQLGPYDGVVATPPPPPYNGEIDVYSDGTTGINANTVRPVAIFWGPQVRGPIDVTYGPHGTATGTGGLLRMPPNASRARAQYAAVQSRSAARFSARTRMLRARLHRR